MLVLAYVGPGLGAGVVATVLGVIASLFLAIFALVWYPVKRLMTRRLRSKGGQQEAGAVQAGVADEG